MSGVEYEIGAKDTTGGAVSSAKSKVEGLAGEVSGEFQKMLGPIKAVRTAIGGLFSALGTVGFVINGWNQWIDTIKSLRDWLDRAKIAAYGLMKAMQNAKFSLAVERAAEKSKYLTENLSKSLGKLKEMEQYGAAWNAGQDAAEDAKTNLDEQRALSGATDEEQRKRIEEDFSVARAEAAWRRAHRNAETGKDSIDSQIKEIRASNHMEENHRRNMVKDREEQRFWLNDGRLTQDEVKAREANIKALDREIAASRKRTEANENMIQGLLRQKTLLDSSVGTAKTNYETEQMRVANERAKRGAEDVEKARKEAEAAEKKAAEAEEKRMRKSLQGQINMARKELQERNAAASAAATRLADARSETQAAQKNFGETMTGSGRRNLRKEERRAAKEERRFQSRLAKLREKYGDDLAPTAFSDEGLTVSEKATRRLAYARANEKAAGKEMERAAKAAENCEKLLEKLTENIDEGD